MLRIARGGIANVRNVVQVRTLAQAQPPMPELAEKLRVTTIPGDGVGPELIASVEEVVKHTGIPLTFDEVFVSEVHHTRSASIDDVIASIKQNNHVALKGVIQESVRHHHTDEGGLNMQLRRRLDLFANVVHIKSLPGIKSRHKDLDFVVVREQTEGEYSALEHESVTGIIECLKITTRAKSERIAKYAFDLATKQGRKKVTAVHKANIMKLGDGLFLNVCREMSKLYPGIKFEQLIIDNACMQLVSNPEQFNDGVLVTGNLYGNIIDNLASGLVGGAGVVSGQSVGSDFVIFEPGSRHSFFQASGRQIANPTAMLLSTANLLRHLNLDDYGRALQSAVEKTIREGKVRTRDLGGYHTTNEFTFAVIDNYV